MREARAALALLDAQHPAEGLRLARSALTAVRASASPEVAHAIDTFLERPLAERDRNVSSGDLYAARGALTLVLERGPDAARDRARVGLGLAVAFAVACTLHAWWPAPPLSARASAVYANLPGYGAAMAIDGDPETSWLLPDETEGSILVLFDAPRRIERVRLTSTHNGGYDDRASDQYVVQAVRGRTVLSEVRGTFTWAGRNDPNEHDLSAEGADGVRVRIESWHRRGGGLAEIALE